MDDDEAGENGDHNAVTRSRHAAVILAQHMTAADKSGVRATKDIFIAAFEKLLFSRK